MSRWDSHKARELLILACTDVENYWRHYLRQAGISPPKSGVFTTNDYVRLCDPLFLKEFEITLPRYAAIPPVRPFGRWSPTSPTQTLPWYDSYNKTKHDRSVYFAEATVWNCVQAVAATLTLFSVRFGPFHLLEGADTFAAVFNQMFSIELRDCSPKSFVLQPPAS